MLRPILLSLSHVFALSLYHMGFGFVGGVQTLGYPNYKSLNTFTTLFYESETYSIDYNHFLIRRRI